MKFYHIRNDYITFLKNFDSKVPYNKHERRPYVGIALEINDIKYYVPFTSPKDKHKRMQNSKDFRKINGGIYGAINFNNMIPVVDSALISFNIEDETNEQYKRLLQNQYKYIKADKDNIKRIAKNLHKLYFDDERNLSKNDLKVKIRCCKFDELEKECVGYNFQRK